MLKTFGAKYDDYRPNGPGWWPRLRPWRAGRDARKFPRLAGTPLLACPTSGR